MPRVLIILPSWVGDAVMATPALRMIRNALPGVLLGGLMRPGIDEILAGSTLLDEVHVERASGVMGPKFAAAKVRPRRYDAALLLTNSFSTALICRMAGIPRRIGYSRDARGILLTDKLAPPKRPDGRWAPVPAVGYYLRAAGALLEILGKVGDRPNRMELGVTPEQDAAGANILVQAGVVPGDRLAILNPGGNKPAKRWPPDRYGAIAAHLHARGLRVLINGSPAEAGLVGAIGDAANVPVANLPMLGVTLGSLKAIVRRAAIMITNDTGPRHIAAAFGVPVVTLFGPTDHRWTTIPAPAGEAILLADPTLPESEVADDHPDRCRIDRITVEQVREVADRLLSVS